MGWSIYRSFAAKLLAAALLTQCSGNGGGAGGRLNPSPGQWTAYGTGTGITTQLPNPFTIPAQSSGQTINYVYTAPGALSSGKTVTLNYSVDGNAKFAPLPETACGPNGCGPAAIRLFIWTNDSNTGNDRWWCPTPKILAIGDNQVFSCVISSSWTGVNGQSGGPTGSDFAMGFTFGGMFAGHGDWTTMGSATFKINSYTVQ